MSEHRNMTLKNEFIDNKINNTNNEKKITGFIGM